MGCYFDYGCGPEHSREFQKAKKDKYKRKVENFEKRHGKGSIDRLSYSKKSQLGF